MEFMNRNTFSLNRLDITITVALKSGLIYVGCRNCVPRTITRLGALMSCDIRLISPLAEPRCTTIHVLASNFTGSVSDLNMLGSTSSSIQKSSSSIFDNSSGKSRL